MRMLRPLFSLSTRGMTGRWIVGVFLLCLWGSTIVNELHRTVLLQLSNNSNNNNEYKYLDEPEIVTVNIHKNVRSSTSNSTSKFPTTVATSGVSTITAPIITTTTTTKKKEKDMIVAGKVAAVADSDSSNDDSHFSACILWMDDNYRLEEWLAYHYYIMKLRYVVIAVDQFSRTSPQHIADRWNDRENTYQLNMTIVTWTDADYVTEYAAQMHTLQQSSRVDSASEQGKKKTRYYLNRQPEFYRRCSIHLVAHNKTWVSYHDTDEFITYKHWVGKPSPILNQTVHDEAIQKTTQPGYILEALNSIKEQNPSNSHLNETGMSCVSVTRRRYCSKELIVEETNQLLSVSTTTGSDVDDRGSSRSGIIPEHLFRNEKDGTNNNTTNDTNEIYNNTLQRFDTLRYKYITPLYDGQPKAFIDLSQQNPQLYVQNRYKGRKDSSFKKNTQWGAHRPMVELCKKEELNRLRSITTLLHNERFSLNHYLGSWAAYSFRDDARQGGLRNYQVWHERSTMTQGEYSHVVRPWLTGFVHLVGGVEVASYLLQEAGKFPPQHNLTARQQEYEHTYDWRSPKLDDDPTRWSHQQRKEHNRKTRKRIQKNRQAREKQQQQREEEEKKKQNAVVSS